MRINRWLLALLSFGFTLTAHATSTLTTFDNSYSAKLYGFNVGVTSRLTEKENNSYEFYFDVNAIIGNVTEVSQFTWNEQGHYIVPTTYTYKRKGLGKNRDQQLNFDWAKNEVTNKDNVSLALDAGKKVQDGLSYQVQLRQDLMAGKKDLNYLITDGKKTKDYKFEVMGEEVLDTPLGQVTTVKIKRSEANDKRAIYAWFAKDFQYLLVRLQQEENGSAYTIYISKASINGKAIEHF